jgi:hypothetical protein
LTATRRPESTSMALRTSPKVPFPILNLPYYPRVLDFEQLKSKKNTIRGRLKETFRTVSLRLRNGQMMAERAELATGKVLCRAVELSDTSIKAYGKRRVHN